MFGKITPAFRFFLIPTFWECSRLDVRAEQPTNHGQLDMVVRFQGRVYIFEFKVNELTSPGRALDQIKEKKYFEPYKEYETYLFGVEFSRDERNITRFEWELWCD